MSLVLVLLACSDSYKIVADDSAAGLDSGATDTADSGEASVPDAVWETASLRITAPRSGAFLPLGEASTFTAEVVGADGQALSFDEVTWASDVDAAWTLNGLSLEDASLASGTHTLTATARLPNGDRLATSVAGILVQSPYAGIYVGTLTVAAQADYNGTPITTACGGAITLVIDVDGTTASGDADCPLNLFGFEVESSYGFDLDNEAGTLNGPAEVQFYGFGASTFDVTGEVTADGLMAADFADDVFGFLAVEGGFEATRITRDLSGI